MLLSVMQTEQIVALLVADRDRLSRAIEALEGPAKRRGRRRASNDGAVSAPKAKSVSKKRKISAAGRKAIADAARRRWAAIRAGKAAAAKQSAGKKS